MEMVEVEKIHGCLGFCMAPFNSRPICRHSAAIFLLASFYSITTKPMSSKGENMA